MHDLPAPSLDTWTILFMLAALQGLVLAVLLWRRPGRYRQANRLLALLLGLFSLCLVEFFCYWTNAIACLPHLARLSLCVSFAFPPILYFYFRTVYEAHHLRARDAWHLVPLIIALLLLLPFYALDADAKRAILQGGPEAPAMILVRRALYLGHLVQLFTYVFLHFRYIGQQPQAGETKRWALALNFWLLGYALAVLSWHILIRVIDYDVRWDYQISALMTLFIFLIGFGGFAQPAIFEGFQWNEVASLQSKYKKSGLTPGASQSIVRQLEILMAEERLFEEPELRLDELALRVGVARHHLSQVINEQYNMSFYEYVNSLRVAEACRLLAQVSNGLPMSISEIAYAVGFNNRVSFNTAFKKRTGETPSAYQQRRLQPVGNGVKPG